MIIVFCNCHEQSKLLIFTKFMCNAYMCGKCLVAYIDLDCILLCRQDILLLSAFLLVASWAEEI